jgi:hypothetical protein
MGCHRTLQTHDSFALEYSYEVGLLFLQVLTFVVTTFVVTTFVVTTFVVTTFVVTTFVVTSFPICCLRHYVYVLHLIAYAAYSF